MAVVTDIEKEIIRNISEALPEMTESGKMYLLGQAEGMALIGKRQQSRDKEITEKTG